MKSTDDCNRTTAMSNALNDLHLIKDGILDKEQLNYIVKNPDEPKCKYTITSLLNLYQKEKRKALSLHDNSVSFKEFKNFLTENYAKSKVTPEAAVKLKDLPDELCKKIVECLFDNQQASKLETEASSSTAGLIKIKKEKFQNEEESDVEIEEEVSSTNTSRVDEVVDMPKTVQKPTGQKKSKTKTQKNEPSLCESMFYVAVNKAQSKGKSHKKGDNLPTVVKEFESLLAKETQLEKDSQKIEKDLANTEKERKKAEKEFEKAEKKFNENMQKLMQALMLCDSLNEAKDKAKEQYASVQQRLDDLEVLKKKISQEKGKVDTRKAELLVFAIRESSATAPTSLDQSESVDILSSSDTSNIVDDKEMEKIIRKKKLSANKRLQELASELDIGAVRFGASSSANDSSVQLDQRSEVTETIEKAKSWKDNYVTMSLNSGANKSPLSFQEVTHSSPLRPSETLPKPVPESSASRSQEKSSKNKTVEANDKKERKTDRETEENRKRSNSESSERKAKITKFEDSRPSSSSTSSSKHSTIPEVNTKMDNEFVKPKGFNAFRDIANCGVITMIKVYEGFVYVASDTGYLRKFNVNNLVNNLFFEGHTSSVQAFALHTITDALYTGCDDGKLRHYDSNTAQLKDSFYLCSAITCMQEGKSILYIGLQNGIIYRLGFMSNKLINSFSVSSTKVLAVKLLAEYSDESRIIVCCSNAISIRNSSNGALLNVFPNSENLGFLHVSTPGFIYFVSFSPSKRGSVLNVRHEKNQIDPRRNGHFLDPRVTAFEMNNDILYFGTFSGRVVCLRLVNDNYELKWISILPNSRTYATSFAIYGSTLLAATNEGSVMKIGVDTNGPHCCEHRFCSNKAFARREDLERHKNHDHWTNARRGTLYQCTQDNCRSVMSSSEVRRPQRYFSQNYYNNYPRRGKGYSKNSYRWSCK